MDGKAYVAVEEWNEVLRRRGLDQVALREGRFD